MISAGTPAKFAFRSPDKMSPSSSLLRPYSIEPHQLIHALVSCDVLRPCPPTSPGPRSRRVAHSVRPRSTASRASGKEPRPSQLPWRPWRRIPSGHFVFFEVDDDGVFSEQASFSLNRHTVEPLPRSADDDHVIAACAPGTGARVASVIQRAWADDGGELIEDEDRVRIPTGWRSRRHAKWAFTTMVSDLVAPLAPLALVINVDRWRSGRLVREHHSVVLRSGGAVIRPVWLVVPDDDEWTEADQLLLAGSDSSEDD